MIRWLSERSTCLLRALGGVAVLALLGWTPTVHAASVVCAVTMSSPLLDFGTVYVPSNAGPGTAIGPAVSASATFNGCNKYNGANNIVFQAVVSGSPTFDSPPGVITFTTNVPGITLQLTPSNPGIAGYAAPTFPAGTIPPPASDMTTTQTYSAQLVTTATPLSPGPLNQILISSYSVSTIGGGKGDLSQNGSLTATGTIKGGGCNIANVSVTLPPVTASQLATAGATTGTTPVPLNLSGCPASTNVSISFSGTAATIGGVASTTVLASTGTAGYVGVQLLDGSGQPVDITGTVAKPQGQTSTTGTLSPSPGYAARYYATGAATPGSVQATATYTLSYQ